MRLQGLELRLSWVKGFRAERQTARVDAGHVLLGHLIDASLPKPPKTEFWEPAPAPEPRTLNLGPKAQSEQGDLAALTSFPFVPV